MRNFLNPIAFLAIFAGLAVVGILAQRPEKHEQPNAEMVANDPTNVEQIANDPNDKFWVTSERLNRRTCPSTRCGIVGKYFFRESATVFETRDGWARVTKYYDASCVSGRSQYVDSGDNNCSPDNGIVEGKFAEWVLVQFLSRERPPDPAADAKGIEALVAGSDDYRRYKTQFVEAARTLISSGRCSEIDFRENGGWVKSSNHSNRPIYFMYCGGFTTANRLYLNAKNGEIFR